VDSRPARSTPTTAPVWARVDKPRPLLIPPLVDTAAGDDVLVGVAGQQAKLEWRVVGGRQLLVR
jgi:hypothetical protein